MAKVWIPVDSGHDYDKAKIRGDLTFLFQGPINVFASDKLVKDIEGKLVEAGENDFLLPSGNALANCVAFTSLMNRWGKVNMLIFSFKNQLYEVRTITMGQFKTIVAKEA